MPLLRRKGLFESNKVVFLPIAAIPPIRASPGATFPGRGWRSWPPPSGSTGCSSPCR